MLTWGHWKNKKINEAQANPGQEHIIMPFPLGPISAYAAEPSASLLELLDHLCTTTAMKVCPPGLLTSSKGPRY